jgi:hypothetical protein
VSPRPSAEQLADHRNVTVLLRLVVDSDGHLAHGEVVGLDGESLGRFSHWERLVELLHERLDTPGTS